MRIRLRALLRGLRSERGSAALFVAIFAPAMIFIAGLVIDGGAGLEAKQRGADLAEQAARAAATQCDVARLRSTSDCQISPAVMDAAARPYLQGVQDVVFWQAVPTRPLGNGFYHGVRVNVTIQFKTTLLGLDPQFKTLTIKSTAEAVAVTGL